jgi:exonuclease III
MNVRPFIKEKQNSFKHYFKLILSYIFINSFTYADYECPIILNNYLRQETPNYIRLMQYNVEWLFVDQYKSCPGTGCTWINESESLKHISYVANVINKLNPDIINLCEVEGCDELSILNSNLYDSYNMYLKKGTDTGTGQNVGMLTKINPLVNLYRNDEYYNYPLNNTNCGYTNASGSTGVSKHYITEYNFNNINVAMIGIHLLAIPTDPSRCVQREGQAQIIQNTINYYINKNYEVIVIGDYNDYDNDILDINNNKPTSMVLDIIKGNKGNHANTYKLYNVNQNIDQNNRFSEWWNSDNNCNTKSINDYSLIDHILVTEKIKDKIINTFIYHDYDEYCGKYDSDHYPLIIDLQF